MSYILYAMESLGYGHMNVFYRVKAYISNGWDKTIVDPDPQKKYTTRKAHKRSTQLERLRQLIPQQQQRHHQQQQQQYQNSSNNRLR